MPQVFLAVRCHRCEAFQVMQRTLKPKFSCKLCGEKQSITRMFASGSAAACRPIVQKLNRARGAAEAAGSSSWQDNWRDNSRQCDASAAGGEEDPYAHPAFDKMAGEYGQAQPNEQDYGQDYGQSYGQDYGHGQGYGQGPGYEPSAPRWPPAEDQQPRSTSAAADEVDGHLFVTELPRAGGKKRSGSLAPLPKKQRGRADAGAAAPSQRHDPWHDHEPGLHQPPAPWCEPELREPPKESLPRYPVAMPADALAQPQQRSRGAQLTDDGACITAAAECVLEEEVWQD